MSAHPTLNRFKTLAGILHGSRAFTGPAQVDLNVTNRCNVRCVHCYFYSPHVDRPNTIEVRLARRQGVALPDLEYLKAQQKLQADPDRTLAAIRQLLALGTQRFQFGGNGEPFVHARVLDFMRCAKEKGAYCIVNTNGTLIDREKADALLDMGFDDLRVTTMAGDRETYCRTHPGGKETLFDDLRENLLYLAAQKKARKPKVTLACVIVAQNHDGLADFARFAGEVKAEEVIFRPFDDVKAPEFAPLMPNEKQAACVKEQLGEAGGYLESAGIRHNVANVLHVFKQHLDTAAFYSVVPCYIGWLSLRIDLNGDVYPCCRSYRPIGNIREQDFATIWKGEAYRRWRKSAATIHKRGTPVEGCACHSCVHHGANMRVYRLLHPLRSRSSRLAQLCSAETGDQE